MRKRITVVTGGSSGLGLAAARCLSSETSLLLCARGKDALEKVREELAGFGADVYTYALDATDLEAVKKCAEYAATLGDVVNVIHTAGASPANTPAEKIMAINTLGPVHVTEAFYPVLAKGGVLILFGSTAGYSFDTAEAMAPMVPALKKMYENWSAPSFDKMLMGFITDGMKLPQEQQAGMAYCISKHFVRNFVYANTWRFAKKGCRILSVSPGSYLTPMHQALIDNQPETAEGVMKGIPLGRWGHPYEMGKLVQFLCSPGAGYVNGVDILADGGCTYAGTVKQID